MAMNLHVHTHTIPEQRLTRLVRELLMLGNLQAYLQRCYQKSQITTTQCNMFSVPTTHLWVHSVAGAPHGTHNLDKLRRGDQKINAEGISNVRLAYL